MTILKPDTPKQQKDDSLKSIFLAGSIEQGKARNWQKECEDLLSDGYNIFNSRRDNWDDTLEQEKGNKIFKQQVSWELDLLEKADYILMYLEAGTKSPISLLELGLFAQSHKMIVVCENDFWRKGNVDIVCERFHISQYDTLNEAVSYLKNKIL